MVEQTHTSILPMFESALCRAELDYHRAESYCRRAESDYHRAESYYHRAESDFHRAEYMGFLGLNFGRADSNISRAD